MNKFFKAALMNLRFETPKGQLTVEQVCQLPLESASNASLDNLYADLSIKVNNSYDKVSFLNKADPDLELNKLRLSIVQEIGEHRLEQRKLAAKDAERQKEVQELTDALAASKANDLANLSTEEIQKRLKKANK